MGRTQEGFDLEVASLLRRTEMMEMMGDGKKDDNGVMEGFPSC